MNYFQFGLFLIYFFSLFCYGARIYVFLNSANAHFLNRFIYVGEVFLLGSIFVVGAMMLLSLAGLYSAPFLWGVVLLGYVCLFSKVLRSQWQGIFLKKIAWDIPLIVFCLLLAVFIFRNCFFLVDVDSHAVYLLTQKLWLANKTSLVGGPAANIGIFVPQFNAVPYALGLSLFGQELLFPQLVVVSWSVIVLLLVFGYTKYRFNGYYALAAVMLVLFNDHFFYSGANSCCIINCAIIAFLFAATYNFWEGRKAKDQFRFILALIFLAQLMANKYQMFYITFFIFLSGLWVQEGLLGKIKGILHNRSLMIGLIFSTMFMFLWYLKNFLMTGVPAFPIMADRFGVFNWTQGMTQGYYKGFVGALPPRLFLKYMNYLFIWPGIDALKIVILIVSLSPLIVFLTRGAILEKEESKEWNYWLALSILVVLGLCLVSFVDPRHYRYGIAIFAFTSVLSLRWIGQKFFIRIPDRLLAVLVILLSLHHAPIVFVQGRGQKYPTFVDNFNVLLNRLHFKDVMGRYYPENLIAARDYEKYPEHVVSKSAWDTGVGGATRLSAFLLSIRPQVGLWHTTAVRWESYENPDAIVEDLKALGIEWVMRVKEDRLIFLSASEYAKEAAGYERYPQSLFYNYGFPQELSEIKW